MSRSRAGLLTGASCAAVLCLTACAATPEEQVLTRFFSASRALDRTALSNLATVTFSPRTDGSVQTFTVAERGAEQRGALTEPHREEARRSLSAASGQDADPGTPVELITRQMTIEADVRAPDGAVAPGEATALEIRTWKLISASLGSSG